MFDDLKRTWASLRLTTIFKTLLLCLLGAGVLLAGLAWLIKVVITASDLIHTPWLEELAGYGGAGLTLLLGWLLFPALISGMGSLFLEDLATQIEQKQYASLPAPHPAGFRDQLRAALKSMGRALGYNLLALPLYFIPVVNVIAYLAVNGRLLARDYYYMVALRHLTLAAAEPLYRAYRWRFWRFGIIISGLFLLPVVNILTPLLATALMTHMLWREGSGLLRPALSAGLALAPSNVLPNRP